MNEDLSDIQKRIRAAQIDLLYRQSWTGLTGVLVVALSACVILWPVVAQWKLAVWGGSMVLLTLARGGVVYSFNRNSLSIKDVEPWAGRHVAGVAASALLWAIPTLFLWPTGLPEYQLVWPILILPLSAAAVATYYTWTSSYLSFVLITVLPISVRFFYEGGFLYTVLGLVSLFFIGVLLRAGRVMHASSINAFELGIRNEALNATLKVEMARLESAYKELEGAHADVRQLSGMLPICSSCKNIRNDSGYWEQLEMYFKENSGVLFSHSICPDCAKKLYPHLYPKP